MNADIAFHWIPLVFTGAQLFFLPLFVIAFNAQIDRRVEIHNANLYAHPALNDLKILESKIEELSGAINDLKITVERLTPRRNDERRGDT